jgi:preprotein translocase subunit SecF
MKFFQLIPSNTKFPFVARRRAFGLGSILAILATFAMLFFNYSTKGSALNFGIDFAGGSSVRLRLAKDLDINEVRAALDEAGYQSASVVAVEDADRDILIRVRDVVSVAPEKVAKCRDSLEKLAGGALNDEAFNYPDGSSKFYLRFKNSKPSAFDINKALQQAGCEGEGEVVNSGEDDLRFEYALVGIGQKVLEDIDGHFGKGAVSKIIVAETVGPKVGDQLKVSGITSLLYAVGLIFLYVLIRFDIRFAPGGIVALAHDGFLVVGFYAFAWKEFNLQSVAAVMTIVGYSINDTIVVFDRVRERVGMERQRPVAEIVDLALNDTLSRTILTAGTTMLVLACIWMLGTGSIIDFAQALLVGMVVGTYSSLFVAAPIFLWINDRFYQGKGHLMEVAGENKSEERAVAPLPAAFRDDDGGEDEDGTEGQRDGGDDAGERKASRRRRRPQSS